MEQYTYNIHLIPRLKSNYLTTLLVSYAFDYLDAVMFFNLASKKGRMFMVNNND